MTEPQSSPQDIIRLDHGYYILATSALTDTRTRVLRQGHSFAVFDRYGDILPVGIGEQGLFHDGTRFLSRFELRMGGQRPLLLGSMVRHDNSLLTVDMANPDVMAGDEVLLPRDTVHIVRFKFLRDAVCYERIRFQNFAARNVELLFEVAFEADFQDIFEVRGMHRKRRGELLMPEVGAGTVRLGYLGLDDVQRTAEIRVNVLPARIDAGAMHFELALGPKQETDLEFSVSCEVGSDKPVPTAFGPALSAARSELSTRVRGAEIVSSSVGFNTLVNRCLSDLTMMTTPTEHGPYPYAGVPWFSTVFGRDGIITALEMLWIDPRVARGVLSFLAAHQASELDAERDAEPGKILHEMRSGEMATLREIPFGLYYGSIDSTPLFVLLAGRYLERTADLDFIAELWPHIERALLWIEEYGDVDDDEFVEYRRKSENGLDQQGWKDSQDSVFHADGSDAKAPIALCEVQGYVFEAYQQGARMARALNRYNQAAVLDEKAEKLRRQFERRFWSTELGTYALALDGDKRPCLVRSSNAGQCLLTGIVGPTRAARVARELMSDHGFSGWGIRTLDARELRYNPMSYHNGSIWPHDNALIAAGFARYGMQDKALQVLQALMDVAANVEQHRLPELFCGFTRRENEGLTEYPLACAPQSWAAGAVLLCLQACLGLSIDATENRVTLARPVLPPRLAELTIRGLEVGKASFDLELRRYNDDVSVQVTRKRGKVDVIVLR